MSCPCRECGVTCGKGASDQCTRTRVGFNAYTNKAYPSYYSDDNAQAVAQPVAEPVMMCPVMAYHVLYPSYYSDDKCCNCYWEYEHER